MYNELFEKMTVDDGLKKKVEERIDAKMKSKKPLIFKAALLAACMALALSAAAFAAYRYLSAEGAVRELGDAKLAESFKGEGMNISAEDGGYRATLLDVRSGSELSGFADSADELSPERTYAVLALERTDGAEMTDADDLMVSPLISGLNPQYFNVFTLGGSSVRKTIDGVEYRIVDCDSIECFADRPLYMAVYEGMTPNSAYVMDGESGLISPKPDCEGANMLIRFALDPQKADHDKAQALIDRVNEEMSPESTDGGSLRVADAPEEYSESENEAAASQLIVVE